MWTFNQSPVWLVCPARRRIWRAHPPAIPIARRLAVSLPESGVCGGAQHVLNVPCALAAGKAALLGQRLLQLRCDLGRIRRNIRRDTPGSYRQQHKHDRKGQGADTCRKVTFRRCVHRVLTLQSSPGPAFTGVAESRGKFVAGERLFLGLFPMPPRRLERRVANSACWHITECINSMLPRLCRRRI
jgi:hypothetical protein